ncbi:MAG: zf-HC2 domain-containing protein [Acidobacteriia bacterium]|nr:zf-HC2 domain-containing protein [Terriglobia bacterium]
MNCKDVLGLSALYLSAELDSERMGEFRRHLESCSACSSEIEHLVDLDARVRDAIAAEPVETAAVEQRVRAEIAGGSRRRWIGIAASVAAAVVIASAGYRVWAAPDRICAAAADDHQREVVEGARRAWRSDAASIAELADREGLSSVAVQRLAPEGFQLEKGKLCRLDGRVFLHLVYSGASGTVSVFLRQRDANPIASIRDATAGAEHVAYFDTDRVSALVVSDGSKESALKVARFAERVL